MKLLKNIWNEEEGQGLVEYGLILALIAIAVIVVLGLIGTELNDLFGIVEDELNEVTVPTT